MQNSLVHDESRISKSGGFCLYCCRGTFSNVGMIFAVSWSIVVLTLGLVFWIISSQNQNSTEGFTSWFGSILNIYVNWFTFVLSTSFLPSKRASKCLCCINRLISCVTCGFLPNLFGTWFIERAKIHDIIRKSIELRGPHSLSLTEEVIEHAAKNPLGKKGDNV